MKTKKTYEQLFDEFEEMEFEEKTAFIAKHLGVKAGSGYICGHDGESIIVGYDDDHGWLAQYSVFADIILKEYKSYLYETTAALSAILKLKQK